MRVTVEVDRNCVTYCCVGCQARLDWTEVMPPNAGTAFVAAHRFCEDSRMPEIDDRLVAPLAARFS